MSRCIDADALRDRLQNLGYDDWNQGTTTTWAEAFSECADMVEEMPTIEPEIVRCKDCKHQVKEWRTDKRLKNKGYMVCGCEVVGDACGYWALLGQDDDFCSYAERRTDVDANT